MLNNPATRPVSRVVVARSKRHPSDGNEKYHGVLPARGGTYFDFNKKRKTIRAERAASLSKCLVKNGVNIIIGKYE